MKIPKIKIRRHPKKIVEKEPEWGFGGINCALPTPFEREAWRRISSINHALRIWRLFAYLEVVTNTLVFICSIIKILPYLPLFLQVVYLVLFIYFDRRGFL